MGQGTPTDQAGRTVTTTDGRATGTAGGQASAAAAADGLADHVAAVEAARAKLGRDLETLTTEVRGQMGQTSERMAWKLLGTSAAVLAGVITKKITTRAWQKTRHSDPPANPAAWETTWAEALAWSAATGVVVGIMRMLAARGAVEGWRRTIGRLPPDMQEVS